MRRSCERPGCAEPVALVYGQEAAPDGTLQFWVDAWSSDAPDRSWPAGTRGAVCFRHGEMLSAPLGWTMVDRRDVRSVMTGAPTSDVPPEPRDGRRDQRSTDDLDVLLDASGPLLRHAFRARVGGRHDASKELMRPTVVVSEDANASNA